MEVAFEVRRYAMIAAGHLLASLSQRELRYVQTFLLFGSVAQNRATLESDVDFFVDVIAPTRVQRLLRAKLNKVAASFYRSSSALDFKLRGIANELSITVGRLAEWSDLRQSIAAAGIVLFGHYLPPTKPPHAFTILSWEKLGKAKGAFLNKVYGYRVRGKRYPGLLDRFHGTKLGRATIMVPAQHRDTFIDALEKYKLDYSRFDVWT